MYRALTAVVVLSFGCTAVLDVSLEDGDTFFAILDSRGDVQDTGVVPRGQAVRAGVDADDTIVLWTFPPGSLLDPHGAVLPATQLRLTAQPPCGRCTAPVDRLPMLLGPGDDCTIPAPFEAFDADGAPLAIDPPDLRLSRPGTCRPEHVAPDATTEIEVCPLGPVEGPIQARGRAITSDGTVIGVNESFVYAANVSGVTTRRTLAVHRRVRAVGTTPDGTHAIYASTAPLKGDFRTRYFSISPALEVEELQGAEDTIEPVAFVRFSAEPDALYLVGGVGDEPGLARCTVGPGQLSCATESVELAGCLADDDLNDAAGLAGGAAIAIHPTGVILSRARPGERWRCDPRLVRGEVDAPDGPVRVVNLLDAAAFEDRWFVCGTASRGAVVLTGTVASDGTIGALDVVHVEPDGYCAGLGVLPPPDGALVANLGRRMLTVGADGVVDEVCEGSGCASRGLQPTAVRAYFGPLVSEANVAMFDDLGGAFVRSGGEPFLSVYGSPDPDDGQVAFVARGAADTGVVFTPDRVREVRHTGSGCEATVETIDGPFELVDPDRQETTTSTTFPMARAAVQLTAGRDGNFWQAGGSPGFVRRVDLASRRVSDRGTALSSFRAFVALADERALLVTDRDLFVVSNDLRAVPIEIEWDDPTTPEAERTVDGATFRAAAASEGIVWIVGGRTLVRVVTTGEGKHRAEGWWTHRLAVPETRFVDFRVVRAFEPDHVVLGATDILSSGRQVVTTWRVGSPNDDCPALDVASPLTICPYLGFDLTAPNSPENDDLPIAVVGLQDRLTWFFPDSATVYRFGADRATFPIFDVRHAVQVDDWVLVGGRGGFGFVREGAP